MKGISRPGNKIKFFDDFIRVCSTYINNDYAKKLILLWGMGF